MPRVLVGWSGLGGHAHILVMNREILGHELAQIHGRGRVDESEVAARLEHVDDLRQIAMRLRQTDHKIDAFDSQRMELWGQRLTMIDHCIRTHVLDPRDTLLP